MRQTTYTFVAVIAFILAVVSLGFCIQNKTELGGGATIVFGLIGLCYLIASTNDNPHNLKTGTVVAQKFTAGHWMRPFYSAAAGVYIPDCWVPDDWALLIDDERGQRGWLHFPSNVFGEHPIGSRYEAIGL